MPRSFIDSEGFGDIDIIMSQGLKAFSDWLSRWGILVVVEIPQYQGLVKSLR